MNTKVFLFLFTLIFNVLNIYSQEYPPEKAFSLKLIDENVLTIKSKISGESLYDTSLISIKIDSLNQYGSDICMYKFELGKNDVKTVSNDIAVSFNMSRCSEYIWAYDFTNKRTFKLKGFFGNDLLFLINTIKNSSYEKKSTQKILKELTALNIGINFCKMYKALVSLNFNDPTLIVCSDGKIANSKN